MKSRVIKNSAHKEFEYIDGVAVPKEQIINKASPARTIAKTISWRIIASITTFVIFYITTGQKIAAAVIGGTVAVEAVAKMVIYFLHERLWENVNWGKYWMRYGLLRRIKLNIIKQRRKLKIEKKKKLKAKKRH
ncbi:MAG: hypothetical protein AUJ98_09870 [Bacteroidetes bacterium CG2_30_33_31]|nr:MAG: hypothetical protein AUJ98_09870 [Bacteroidetes bacterium CG2_30_33_31]